MTHRFPTGVQSLCTGDVCHVPIAEGVSTFYILFQPKCNRRFIFTWSVIYFTVFYANSMTYYLKRACEKTKVFSCVLLLIDTTVVIFYKKVYTPPFPIRMLLWNPMRQLRLFSVYCDIYKDCVQ